mmetsp:Transcript_3845/g.5288  ORF Transcript_3845/g.5288 Transcript_3845/m.5288 type:complete len:99 (-) Transcript_3845:497-793(-)
MAMKIAVYRVPPNPIKLKGAKELRLLSEQRGKSTNVDKRRITLDRWLIIPGRLNVWNKDVKESPIIIEYAREAKKHIAVMQAEMTPAVLGLMVFAHAS